MSNWSCGACTFLNETATEECQMCGTAKPDGAGGDDVPLRSEPAQAQPQPEEAGVNLEAWNCGACTYENTLDKTACEMCGTARPADVMEKIEAERARLAAAKEQEAQAEREAREKAERMKREREEQERKRAAAAARKREMEEEERRVREAKERERIAREEAEAAERARLSSYQDWVEHERVRWAKAAETAERLKREGKEERMRAAKQS